MKNDERAVRELFERHVGGLHPSAPVEEVRRRARRGRTLIVISSATALAVMVMAAVVVAATFQSEDRDRVVGPAPSPDQGLIAFITQDNNDMTGWIAVVPASGGEAKRLHEGRDPAWSPDGTRIAFGCDRGICTMNADGSDVRQLTDPREPAFDESPDWGSNGMIAFTRTYLDADTGRKILVVPEQGGRVRVLIAEEANFSADWHPDGQRLALVRGLGDRLEAPVGGFQLWTMNADASGLRQLTDVKSGIARPDWSPDGQTILFDSGSALWTIPAGGGEPHKLPVVSGRGFDVGSSGAWAPDSKRIAFTCSTTGTDNNDICLSDVDSEEWTAVLATNHSESSPAWQPASRPVTESKTPSASPTDSSDEKSSRERRRCTEEIPFEPTYLPPGFEPELNRGPAPGGRPPDSKRQVIFHLSSNDGRAIEVRRPGTEFAELAQGDDAPTIKVLGTETSGFAPIQPGGDDFIVQFGYPSTAKSTNHCASYSLDEYGVSLDELKKVAEGLQEVE